MTRVCPRCEGTGEVRARRCPKCKGRTVIGREAKAKRRAKDDTLKRWAERGGFIVIGD